MGGPEGPTEIGGVCETEAGTEADVEDEDDDVDVVGGVDEVGVSGYESEGFTLSEILRRKKVTEGVLDTAHLPQCEFSNLHLLPLALLLELLCWPVTELYWASYAARWNMKMTSRGCCVLVHNRSEEPVVHANEPGLPRTDVSGSEFEVGAPTSEEETERKKSRTKCAPKSPLTAVLESWLLSILPCKFSVSQWLIPCLFPGDAEMIQGVSGNEDVSTGVETDGQLRGRHIVVTRSLVPFAGGPSMMSLGLSIVKV